RDLRRQKMILVIGSEIKVTPDPFADAACWYDIKAAREKMYAALDRANAVLYHVDPVGLRTLAPTAQSRVVEPAASRAIRAGELVRAGDVRVVTARTGGRSIGSNFGELEIPALFAETQSYYLVG